MNPEFLQELGDELRKMLKFVEDPHQGVATWNMAMQRQRGRILELLDGVPKEAPK